MNMNVALDRILKNHIFDNATIIAGESGTNRIVRRVSVFDSPFQKDVIEKKIVKTGDLFITGLLRFQEAEVRNVVGLLIESGCAGLIWITENATTLVGADVKSICNQYGFPIVLIEEDISYAEVLEVVNRYINSDMINVINQSRITRIMEITTSVSEKIELLSDINPCFEENLLAIYYRGKVLPAMEEINYNSRYIDPAYDVFINLGSTGILILSHLSLEQLNAHKDVLLQVIRTNYQDSVIGIGRVYRKNQIDRALSEAKNAMTTAMTLHNETVDYNPLSVLQLLLPLQGNQVLADFYDEFIKKIEAGLSQENKEDYLVTMRTFIASSGDFKAAAAILHQHENTGRYRINKIKSLLEFGDSSMDFYELLGIAVKVEKILGYGHDPVSVKDS
jgi:sugar diacid utilization regulator